MVRDYIFRVIEFGVKFITCLLEMGLFNTLCVFSYVLPISETQRELKIKGKRFIFYPNLDKGPISHLYTRNFSIEGSVNVILDVGANIGVETFRFREMHKDANVVSIEPSARNFSILEKNFKDDRKVCLINGALWKSSGILQLRKNENQSHESWRLASEIDYASSDFESVRTYSMTEVLELSGIGEGTIDILKIDIEGAEAVVFCEGDNSWLSQVRVVIMELPDNDNPGTFQRIMETFFSKNLQFNTYINGENIVLIRRESDLKMKYVIGSRCIANSGRIGFSI
jgi:FkbM family methyltransferase